MATNLLWFVMAGFLLGFATSTLWEWFYFRKERLKLTDRRIRELEAKLREPETINEPPSSANALPTVASVTGAATSGTSRTSAWGDTGYRSPGVFLESEELKADGGENALMGRERPRTSLTGTPGGASPSVGLGSAATLPTVNNVTPAASASSPTVASSTPPPATLPDTPIIPRADQTPADALRAKRGDSPRSRQEVLAALRRNSEAAQRGQLPRSETETPPQDRPSEVSPSTPLRASSLVSPTPLHREEAHVDEPPAESPSQTALSAFVAPTTAPPPPCARGATTLGE